MGRQHRIQYPGAVYHVFARGINRQPIFTQREDYERFIESLERAIEFAQFQVWCYALMDNHYHLLIMTPNGNLTQAMHALQNRYVKSFNAAHDRIGPLFQGRYKSLVVTDENYLVELSRYIHLNPYRKRTVKKPERYEWCSYGALGFGHLRRAAS
jgi:REP element-mobilizing transposase RayT